MNGPRPRADLSELNGVGDGLGSRIQIAQTARRKLDSRLVARLKVAEPSEPERRETGDSPGSRRVQCDQHHGERGAGAQRDDAKSEPLPAAAWPDVGN